QSKLLDHPHIVKLLTVDIINGTIVMVMEYIKGTDLETLIDEEEKLSIKTSLRYLKQILSALEFAHEHKVIHRDIRPSNILLNEKNNVKITDFGTSTLLNEKQYATTRIGSPPYMAPEQFEGKAVFPSDIYSAGCLFYEMVTGFPPIVRANPMEIYKMAKSGNITPLIKKNPSITSKLNWILMKCLSPDLNVRQKTVTEVIKDLDNMEEEKGDHTSEMKSIKNRISARNKRNDHVCWNCHKTMPRKMKKCLYCDAEQ
ncbi:MAG: serine/threonine protein kinase, partial [Candidatus Aminicenantes bacterium]|nr:serine/threonine protein kinase [Candidatus Aminicenantes bacterium]